MKLYDFSGVVTALSSIAHSGSQSLGITQMLRREKVVQPDGTVEEVPVVSGNGMRGLLRDRGMLHMCRALGYGAGDGKPAGLSLPAFYFLFSGGTLTADAGKGLDLNAARRMRELIPLIGIFGAAHGNQIMPGKLKVGKLIPLCIETVHLVPDRFRELATQSVWSYCQQEMYTRKDDEKNERLRPLIAPAIRELIEAAPSAKRSLTTDAGPDDTGAVQQMMYYIETFAAGTRFFWRITIDDVTDIERDAFLVTLAEFSRSPFIGGKSAAGLGEVAIRFDQWWEIDSRVAPLGREVSFTVGTMYMEHLRAQAAAIRAELAGIA